MNDRDLELDSYLWNKTLANAFSLRLFWIKSVNAVVHGWESMARRKWSYDSDSLYKFVLFFKIPLKTKQYYASISLATTNEIIKDAGAPYLSTVQEIFNYTVEVGEDPLNLIEIVKERQRVDDRVIAGIKSRRQARNQPRPKVKTIVYRNKYGDITGSRTIHYS